MGKIIFVTGGSRSGKSSYAQKLAEAMPGPRAFVATCPRIDDEMQARIAKHQNARSDRDWQTIEETLDLAKVIHASHQFNVLLVDCLTLWINNLLYQAEQAGNEITESDMSLLCRSLIDACRAHPGTILFVTNETGMGIVPENRISRLYRDLAGRCNQAIADASHRAILLVSG